MQAHPELQSLREAKLILEREDTYGIYQLRWDSLAIEELLHHSMTYIQRHGYSVERENYNLVYTDHLYPADTLESIYARFHQDRQLDFDGPSLMVSDVIVMNREGVLRAYYVDNLGFRELKDFLPALENPKQKQRQAVEGKEKRNLCFKNCIPIRQNKNPRSKLFVTKKRIRKREVSKNYENDSF